MTRFWKALVWVLLAAALLAGVRFIVFRKANGNAAARTEVKAGPIEVWSVYEGSIESRNVRNVMSPLNGPAVIVELAPDGALVQSSDVLVRFDGSQWERELLRLERDVTLAREDLRTLSQAKLPLEMRDLETRLSEARRQQAGELAALNDNRDLARSGLIATQEVALQEVKVEAARAAAAALEQQADLTRRFLHPAAEERARAVLASADQEAAMAARQVSNCVVRAPCGGMLAHKAVNIGGEFRAVRVGDTVYKNQPFLTVSDMSNLVLCCDVPEAELRRIPPGARALVQPAAYPEMVLSGSVDTVGSMAQAVAGRPAGQKYFSVVVRLNEHNALLRPGMSAQLRVLTYARTAAILVPRTAVWWEGDVPWCTRLGPGGPERVRLALGMADDMRFEVLAGLKAGDSVALP